MVEFSFFGLSAMVIVMLLFLFRSYPLRKVITYYSLGIGIWILYLIILDQTGFLRDFGLPPRVPALIVLPAIALIVFLVNRKFMKDALHSTPFYLPIALQSFRILVELLIYVTYLKGIFPQRATFEGLNFDIIVGISALFMAGLVARGVLKRPGILIWNLASLGILLLTVYSFISSYYFRGFITTDNGQKIAELPYLLLPAVLLPTAVLLHAFSIRQVLVKKDVNTK